MNNEAIYENSQATRRKITEILSREEMAQLTRRSNLMGAWAIASTWGLIAFAFTLLAVAQDLSPWLGVPVALLGIALLGGRQLALAICTHEATHRTLFATRWLNDGPTDWLCARPIGLDLAKYRDHHFIHHTKTGTDEDSDISLISGLPTTPASLRRKFARDLVGITGLKFLFGRLLMEAGLMKWTVASHYEWLPRQSLWHHLGCFLRNFFPTFLTNLALFAVLYASGHPELYLGWIVAYVIPYPLFVRIRALAEHAATERTLDMFRNTRTTRAGLVARTFVAPLHVNFHIEHHALASAPWHRLPAIHRLFRERRVLEAPPGYWDVMGIVSSATPADVSGR